MNARYSGSAWSFSRYSLAIGALSLFFAAACGADSGHAPAVNQGQAENLAQRFYAIQRGGDFTKLDALYSKTYLQSRPQQQRVSFLTMLNERLGTVKEVTIESWQAAHSDKTGDAYELVYQVIRSKRIARETLVLVPESDSLRIRSYTANSDGLLISDTAATGQ